MNSLPVPDIQLNDGNLIPQLGLGVWQLSPAETERTVGQALELGYRHFDTAAIYKNEKAVGRAIASSGIAREELFITTKLWNADQTDAIRAFEKSLERLGLDRVDLYLVHWPVPARGHSVSAWRQLVEIVGSGRSDSIGVSNFEIAHLQQLLTETGVVPAVNQIELHPLHQRSELNAFCVNAGIAVQAWSPLGQGNAEVLEAEAVRDAARGHEKTPAQVVLRWHLQQGRIVFPKTSQRKRLVENADVFDFVLTPDELLAIDHLDQQHRFGPDPFTFGA